MSRRSMSVYLAPFEAAIQAEVSSVMCSYNRVNGPHACGNASYADRDSAPRAWVHGLCDLGLGCNPLGAVHECRTRWPAAEISVKFHHSTLKVSYSPSSYASRTKGKTAWLGNRVGPFLGSVLSSNHGSGGLAMLEYGNDSIQTWPYPRN
jgi:hypothetical protein